MRELFRELGMIASCAVVAGALVLGGALFAVHEVGRSFDQPVASAAIAPHPPWGAANPLAGWKVIRRYVSCVHIKGHELCRECTVYAKGHHRRTVCVDPGW